LEVKPPYDVQATYEQCKDLFARRLVARGGQQKKEKEEMRKKEPFLL